jgi:hypothetical protein
VREILQASGKGGKKGGREGWREGGEGDLLHFTDFRQTLLVLIIIIKKKKETGNMIVCIFWGTRC